MNGMLGKKRVAAVRGARGQGRVFVMRVRHGARRALCVPPRTRTGRQTNQPKSSNSYDDQTAHANHEC